MRYRLAIFDMDGTILNTIEDLTNSLNFALSKMNLPTKSVDEVKFCVGNGLHKTVERAVPEGSTDDLVEKVYDIFVPHYRTHSEVKTAPYPGVIELIRTLKSEGVKTAVVSNKRNETVQTLADKFFPGLFDMALGEKDGVNPKPAPDAVYMVLNTLKIHKSDAVYIGDSNVDAETARNSGLDLIAVDWGFRSRKFLEDLDIDCIVSSAYEIEKLILTDLSAVKKVYCSACGAEFMDNRDRCPACGMLYEPAAERIYMDKLEGIRDDVDNLGLVPGQETVKELKKTGKRVAIIVASIVLVIGVLVGLWTLVNTISEKNYDKKQKDYNIWAAETYPVWDEMYDAGEYDELLELYLEAGSKKYATWNYQHAAFLSMLDALNQIDYYYAFVADGSKSDAIHNLLLDYCFEVTCREDRACELSPKELEYVASRRANVVEILDKVFHLTPDELWELLAFDTDYNNSHINWDKLKPYVLEHMDEFG